MSLNNKGSENVKLLKKPFFQQTVTVVLSVIVLIIASQFCKYEPALTTDSELQHAVVNEIIATTTEPSINNKNATSVI